MVIGPMATTVYANETGVQNAFCFALNANLFVQPCLSAKSRCKKDKITKFLLT